MKIFIGTASDYTKTLTSTFEELSIEHTTDQKAKRDCDLLLYAVTSDLQGVSHIIEAVNDSNHWTEKTIFCTFFDDSNQKFNDHQVKSLIATGKMIRVNGGHWFESEKALLDFINLRL